MSDRTGIDVPDQPDGIDAEDYVLPDPVRAAARVIAFVSEFGDGIVEMVSDRAGELYPLYARDLEALAKAVSQPECGTGYGYQRHLTAGEPPCDPRGTPSTTLAPTPGGGER